MAHCALQATEAHTHLPRIILEFPGEDLTCKFMFIDRDSTLHISLRKFPLTFFFCKMEIIIRVFSKARIFLGIVMKFTWNDAYEALVPVSSIEWELNDTDEERLRDLPKTPPWVLGWVGVEGVSRVISYHLVRCKSFCYPDPEVVKVHIDEGKI